MQSCYDMIHEFNEVAARIPPQVRDKIYTGEKIAPEEMNGSVERALYYWGKIQERLNLIPQYELMVQ